jgi:hypothetical protein
MRLLTPCRWSCRRGCGKAFPGARANEATPPPTFAGHGLGVSDERRQSADNWDLTTKRISFRALGVRMSGCGNEVVTLVSVLRLGPVVPRPLLTRAVAGGSPRCRSLPIAEVDPFGELGELFGGGETTDLAARANNGIRSRGFDAESSQADACGLRARPGARAWRGPGPKVTVPPITASAKNAR